MLIKNSKDKFYESDHDNISWLKSRFHFSFAEYYDPDNESFGSLRVLNDDEIDPHSGFDTHPHRDMEIITYAIKGELSHKDSIGIGGNSQVLTAGNIQYLSAGTGITHSEKNESDEVVELFQLWILPTEKNLTPNYGQQEFDPALKKNKLLKMAGPDDGDGSDGSVKINQDAILYSSLIDDGAEILHELKDRIAYLVVVEGAVIVKGNIAEGSVELKSRDALRVYGEDQITIKSAGNSEFILVDMAGESPGTV